MTQIQYEILKESQGALHIHMHGYATADQFKKAAKNSEALQLLLQEEMHFPIVDVRSTKILPVLKALSLTNQLYFNGRQLVCDFYSKCVFAYKVSSQGSVTGILRGNDWELPLTQCDFLGIGSPHWFITGIRLRLIATDVDKEELLTYSRQSIQLDRTKIEQLILEAKEDNAPQVILESNLTGIPTNDPTPVLILKDRSGAFADLWMDYGESKICFHDTVSNIKRKVEIEKGWEKDLLETDFIRKNVGSSHYFCPLDKVPKALTFLLEIGWNLIDHQGRKILRAEKWDISSEDQPQHFKIQGTFHYGEHKINLKDVVGAFNKRETFVQLNDGAIGILPQTKIVMEEMEIIQDEVHIPRYRLGAFQELAEDHPMIRSQIPLSSFTGLQEALPTESFQGILRPYQQTGVNWLQFLYDFGFHGLLADDMGLGKTVQVLAFLSRLSFEKPYLIVVTTSILFNWEREIRRFLPGMPVHTYRGTERELKYSGIVLTTYAILRSDQSLLSTVDWECVFLDEAQAIKNPNTQTAKAAFLLKGKLKIAITGTPIENQPLELWSLFRFLIPGLLGSQNSFEGDIRAGEADSRYRQKIKRLIRPFLLRRRKEDVLKDLPERIDQVVWIEMAPQQRQLYEQFLRGYRSQLISKVQTEGIGKHRMEVLEAILRLRQICCHSLLVQSEEGSSAKLEALIEDLLTIHEEGSKGLIYSQFTSMLKLIAKELSAREIPFSYLDGSTNNREEVVDSFQNNASIPFFLISLKAGGVGLNLTAADYVLIYDPWWNEAVENQAINRAHRIGRKDAVIAKKYIIQDSVEEKVLKLQARKTSLAENLLEEDIQIERLSSEDLLFLLE